jgi:hypothetical protein
VKRVILYFLLVTAWFGSYAQGTTQKSKQDKKDEKRQRINAMVKQEEEGNLSYVKQNGFGIQLRTNGYGFFYEIGRRVSQRYTNTYSIELSEIKNPKEEKVGGAENFFGNPYVYGKVNNFYQAKLGFGKQYIFGQKGNKNGVAVIGLAQGGVSVGLAKPYYINIESPSGRKTIKYDSPDSSNFLAANSFGNTTGAGFTKGWNELKVKPGLYAKTGLRFDFGRYNESVQAIEIGLSLEYYFQDVQLLALNEPQRLFFQGHLAFVFGRRK